jgi:hypothetical protein
MPKDTASAFDTRGGFQAALQAAIEAAIDHEATSLRWVDPDFRDWPLDDAAVRDALARWCRPGRRLTLLATGFEALVQRHPRFVAWRRLHAHVIVGRAVTLDASEVPTVFLGSMGHGLIVLNRERLARERLAGRAFVDPADWRTWNEVVDALMQQSHDSFAATTLGL